MIPANPANLEMFSRDWYNEYFQRAATSPAHALFCEKVYGKDLCQHGLMDMAELDFLISLIEPGARILEIGCSNGRITEYIQERTGAEILGLDYSDVAIEQACQRMQSKSDKIHFQQVDLAQEAIPGEDYDFILLIDSIYFLGDFKESLLKFGAKLNPKGKLLVSFFQDQEAGPQHSVDKENEILTPDNTLLARALRESGYAYEWYDFTANVRRHGIKNYQVGEELREAFEQEGNAFLYQARAAENRGFKEKAEKQLNFRYLYVARRD